MATHKGSEGLVKVGSNTVAEVTGWEYTETAQVIDDSELTDDWDTHLIGSKSASGSLSCHWDESDTNGQEALDVGASVTLNLYPEGATTGDTYVTMTASITEVTMAAERNGVISRGFKFQASGAPTWGTVV